MQGMIYSYDLHWLIDPDLIQHIYVAEFSKDFCSVFAVLKNSTQHTVYKGSREECERRLDNFMTSLGNAFKLV